MDTITRHTADHAPETVDLKDLLESLGWRFEQVPHAATSDEPTPRSTLRKWQAIAPMTSEGGPPLKFEQWTLSRLIVTAALHELTFVARETMEAAP